MHLSDQLPLSSTDSHWHLGDCIGWDKAQLSQIMYPSRLDRGLLMQPDKPEPQSPTCGTQFMLAASLSCPLISLRWFVQGLDAMSTPGAPEATKQPWRWRPLPENLRSLRCWSTMELQVNSMAPGAVNDSTERQQLWLKLSRVVGEHSNKIVVCSGILGNLGTIAWKPSSNVASYKGIEW